MHIFPSSFSIENFPLFNACSLFHTFNCSREFSSFVSVIQKVSFVCRKNKTLPTQEARKHFLRKLGENRKQSIPWISIFHMGRTCNCKTHTQLRGIPNNYIMVGPLFVLVQKSLAVPVHLAMAVPCETFLLTIPARLWCFLVEVLSIYSFIPVPVSRASTG